MGFRSTTVATPLGPTQPIHWLLLAWGVGTCAARLGWAPSWAWAVAAVALPIAAGGWMRGRPQVALAGACLVAAAMAGARWETSAAGRVQPWQDLLEEERLVEVQGTVVSPPSYRIESPGAMGAFDYRPPKTSFDMRVERVLGPDGSLPTGVVVRVGVPALDRRIHPGDRIRARGWLREFEPPANPGVADYGKAMALRGVVGRLSLEAPGNWERREGVTASALARARETLQLAAAWALRRDLPPQRHGGRGLLDALLLGNRDRLSPGLEQTMRRIGLGHILSISGLHLGILAAGIWIAVAAATGRPRWAVLAAILGVGVYLLVVPARIPILRAGAMVAVGGVALARGRRAPPTALLAAAALVLLVWEPSDLFSPGFQLSFGIVAGLILFARPASERIMGVGDPSASLLRRVGRIAVGWVVVSAVAWLVALPLVAYHFHFLSPFTVVWTVLLLPPVAVLLWAAYFKVVLTLLWPAAGSWLAAPLLGLADAIAGAARWASDVPYATVDVAAPSAAWAATCLAVVAAALGGWYAGGRWRVVASACICSVWLFFPAAWATVRPHLPNSPVAEVRMFAVGAGSAILLRSDHETLLFDCGSRSYIDITTATVGPALRSLGVRRVDTLVLSHADLDHFSGAVELVDRFRVRRVLITPHFLEAAREQKAAKRLLELLRAQDVPIRTISAGWERSLGRGKLRALWPPAQVRREKDNNNSLVLSFRAAGRRVLLTGDIEAAAMEALSPPAADVLELPHHGAYHETADSWVNGVDPAHLLQSCGRRRFRHDKWSGRLPGFRRWVTARDGAITVRVTEDGGLHARAFRDPEGR